MIHELRRDPKNSLKDITKKITDECCTDYYSKDNITLIIVDLKKYLAEHQQKQLQSPISNQQSSGLNNTNSNGSGQNPQRRCHSQTGNHFPE